MMPGAARFESTMQRTLGEALRQYAKLLMLLLNDVDKPLAEILRENRGAVADIALAALGAGGALAGAAIWVSSLGFWASIGYSLGLVSMPFWAPVAGGVAGFTAAALGIRALFSHLAYRERLDVVALAYHASTLVARADRVVTQEERDFLGNLLLGTGLNKADLSRIVEDAPGDVAEMAVPKSLAHEGRVQLREAVLVGCWQLALSDGLAPEEEHLLEQLRRQLQVNTSSEELHHKAEELSDSACRESEALVAAARFIVGDMPHAQQVIEDLLAFNPRAEARERLRAAASKGLAVAAAAGAILAVTTRNADLMRLILKAYVTGRSYLQLEDTEDTHVLRDRAVALAEELGIPRSVAAQNVDQMEDALAREIKSAMERVATATEKDRKKRNKD